MPDSDLHQRLSHFETACQKDTVADLANLLPEVKSSIQQQTLLLEQLYRFSCCFWGCHGKEHVFEHLAGRCVSSLVAADRLASTGYYDECLSLVRSVGEIANLLNLFWVDNSKIRQWLDSSGRERRREFKPCKVRKALAEKDWLIPFTDDHYGRLCEKYVHPTPNTKPQAHNDVNRPILGAHYQRNGFVTSHWESCWALSVVAGPIAKLAHFPESEAKKMVEWTAELFELSCVHIDEGGE